MLCQSAHSKKGKTSLFKRHKGLLVTYFTNNLMKFASRVYSNTVFDLMPSFRPPLTYPDMQFLSLDGPRFIGYINFVDPLFWLGSVYYAEKCIFPSKMKFLKMTVKNVQFHGIRCDHCKHNKSSTWNIHFKLNFQIFYSIFTLKQDPFDFWKVTFSPSIWAHSCITSWIILIFTQSEPIC